MYTSYAYAGLVNYQYFKGWKDAMVTDRSLSLHLSNHKRKSINSESIAKIAPTMMSLAVMDKSNFVYSQ